MVEKQPDGRGTPEDRGPPDDRERVTTSRRALLLAAGAAGAVAGTGGIGASSQSGAANAQETTTAAGQEGFVPAGPDVGVQRIADGPLVSPISLEFVPGAENQMLLVDQPGVIYVLDREAPVDYQIRDEPFLDITDRVEILTDARGGFQRPQGFDERGLLGFAFHPDFQENRRFYVRYSAPPAQVEDDPAGPAEGIPEPFDHVAVLSEFEAESDALVARPESERVLLETPEPQFNHNAGVILFGPDGYLFTNYGDGGGADDTGIGHVDDWYDDNDGGNGQDVTKNLLGSVVRIDVDSQEGDRPYGIPDDNPFVGSDEGLDEIYAWGLRNPWRMSLNDGTLVTADVGQNLFEEVDIIEKGRNYGWNVKEGPFCFSTSDPNQPGEQCPSSTPDDVRGGEELVDPVFWYPHQFRGQSVGISVTGGFVYQGSAIAELQGRYVFGDWSQSFTQAAGRLFVGDLPDGTETDTPGTEEDTPGTADDTPTETGEQPSLEDQQAGFEELNVTGAEGEALPRFINGFGRDPDGELYALVTRTGRLQGTPGEVYKLVPAGEGEQVSQPGAMETETTTEGAETTPGGGETTETETTTEPG